MGIVFGLGWDLEFVVSSRGFCNWIWEWYSVFVGGFL